MAFNTFSSESMFTVHDSIQRIKIEFVPGNGEERAFIGITTPGAEADLPLIVRVDGELVVDRS